jgi:hypothetical protein
VFNHKKFLKDNFHSPIKLVSFLTAYGADTPELAAVYKWFSRGTVPSDWFAVLLAYLELENGNPVRLHPYLKGKRR